MGGRHEQLGTLDDVVLLGVVLEEDTVVAGTRPMADAVQNLLMVLQSAL